jgi:DNA polymerase-3 subunit delta'
MIGHERTARSLLSALERERLPHALLFTGPEGIGKFLAASELAARILCAADQPPCGTCNACVQVAAETHPDLFIVRRAEGKKEIGVDLARSLKRFASLRPAHARRKIALIDDADRLSVAAQNALLKTLEEPPGAALIVLVTASPGALLPTVRSRLQRIRFEPLTIEQVSAVLKQRGGLADEEACALAEASDGSPGRALRLQGVLNSDELRNLVQALAEIDPARYGSILRLSKAVGGSESDMSTRLEFMLSLLRDAAIRAIAGDKMATWTSRVVGSVPLDVDSVVGRAAILADALEVLRRRNPNRTLLAEALALRLARA